MFQKRVSTCRKSWMKLYASCIRWKMKSLMVSRARYSPATLFLVTSQHEKKLFGAINNSKFLMQRSETIGDAPFSCSHQTRNRQNQHILIGSEQDESESRSWRRMDMQMHRQEDLGMFSQCFCDRAMPWYMLQRCCANIWVCWTATMGGGRNCKSKGIFEAAEPRKRGRREKV